MPFPGNPIVSPVELESPPLVEGGGVPLPVVVENEPRRFGRLPRETVFAAGLVENAPANDANPVPVSIVEAAAGRRDTPATVFVSGAQRFVEAAPDVTPPPTEVFEAPVRRRETPEAVVVSAARIPVAEAFVAPPPPVVAEAAPRRRETPAPVETSAAWSVTGAALSPPDLIVVEPTAPPRRTPDPVALRGPAPVATPPPPQISEAPQRRRVTPDPVVLSGVLAATVTPEVVYPPRSVVVLDERGRQLTLQPVTGQHGFLGNTPANEVTPPPATVVDRPEKRRQPEPSIALNGSLAADVAPAFVKPPAPYVVPLTERRRILEQIAEARRGYDDFTWPPGPSVTDRPERRRTTPDHTSLHGAVDTTPVVFPPGPFIVPPEERRKLLSILQPFKGEHGFVGNAPANGVLPRPLFNLDRYDQRHRYLPLPMVLLSGVYAPEVAPPAPSTGGVEDFAPIAAAVGLG